MPICKSSIPYVMFLYIWTQANVNLRKIYINLGNYREYPHILYNLESVGYIFVADATVYLHSNFRGELRKTHMFWNTVRNGPSRSSKVVDFGTNRKCICDFLLVINSNLGPILPRFRDIAGFRRRATPPLFHPNFSGIPFGLDVVAAKTNANYSCN